MKHLQLIACVAAFTCCSSGARAAVAGPIESESRAARAVVTALLLRNEVQNLEHQFLYSSRDLIDRALRQFASVTSYAAVAASPEGITLACPISGTVSARVTNSWLRVVKFEWQECVREEFAFIYALDGPAEVTLLASTLAPSKVASIRFGDRQRDLVQDLRPGPDLPPDFGGRETIYRNMRLTGVLPLARDDERSFFPGRYAFEVSGYFRFVQHIANPVSGDPQLFDHDHLVSTDGAVISGEFTNVGYSYNTDFRLLLGKFTERLVTPSTPTSPVSNTFERSMRGVDLRVQFGFDNDLLKYHLIVDGKLESDMNVWWGFNCTAPDVFIYRTRTPLTHSPDAWTGHVFEAGELGINGNTTARFSSTGTSPYADLLGRVTLDVTGVGTFAHDVTDWIYNSTLFTTAPCAP